jgi:hypothetical protein
LISQAGPEILTTALTQNLLSGQKFRSKVIVEIASRMFK